MEAVFPSEIFRIFSDDFRLDPAENHGKFTGIHRKKSNKFSIGILLALPAVSVAFLQDPAAVVFDMGSFELTFHFHGYAYKSLRFIIKYG